MLYEFELGDKIAEATKNIYCEEPRQSGRAKSVDSENVLKAKEANLTTLEEYQAS